uniref:OsmC family protein n=1 Tax=Hylemonella sp. TaxID=2066020 RepID=UPI0035B10F96
MSVINVQECQRPLRARYKAEPGTAWVTDSARTRGADLRDPFHFNVEPKPGSGQQWPVGTHSAVGGPYDAPCPGDILCAALAACQESSIRIVANLLGVELVALSVEVTGGADLRGALGLDLQVPVGFQSLRCDVHLKAREGTRPELLAKLRAGAERCCVVLQTLRQPPTVVTTYHEG